MRVLLPIPFLVLACASASTSPHTPSGADEPAEGAPAVTPASVDEVTLVEAEAPPEDHTAEPQTTTDPAVAVGPSSCPAGMKLVEGEYCTEVEQTCLKEWFDKSNQKKVCEKFAPPTRCVGAKVKKRVCMDTYAWPNVKGERPEVMNQFYQAQVKCAAVGKRMCTESEWTLACEGPEMKPFPHGFARDPLKCNGDHPWDGPRMKRVAKRDPKELARLWRGVPSGSQPECISDFGVADLPGNNDEVVSSENFSSGWKGKFDSVHTGGPWYKGVRNQCRPKIYTHDEGFYYYFLGFRCCAEPDGASTDPRTPKQVKKGTKFEYVERMARFSVDEMKLKIEEKKKGQCSCRDKDILCKTMCGTLLGPGAKDATNSDPRP